MIKKPKRNIIHFFYRTAAQTDSYLLKNHHVIMIDTTTSRVAPSWLKGYVRVRTAAATAAGTSISTFREQIAETRPDYRLREIASSLSGDDNKYRSMYVMMIITILHINTGLCDSRSPETVRAIYRTNVESKKIYEISYYIYRSSINHTSDVTKGRILWDYKSSWASWLSYVTISEVFSKCIDRNSRYQHYNNAHRL